MKKWEYSKPDDIAEDELFLCLSSEPTRQLPDHFTEQVMDRLYRTEILPASGTRVSVLSGMRRARRVRLGLQWGGAAAGAVALVLLITSAVSEPSLTHSPIKKLFVSKLTNELPAYTNEWPDVGLQEAQELGVVQQPNIQVSDHGFVFSLQTVVADPTRTVLTIRITDSAGKPADAAMNRFDFNQLHIKNEAGADIGELRSTMPIDNPAVSGKSAQKYVMLTYIFPNEKPGDSIVIQGDVHELENGDGKGKALSGDWSFSYKADMTKARDLSVTSNLNESYTTPEGLNVEMEQLVRTPAGVQLKFSTSLTAEAAARTPENLRNLLGVMFHFEDENKHELSRINSSNDDGGRIDTTISYSMEEDAQDGKQHWTYYFYFLPYDSMKVRFILDGYYIPVESNDSITFRPKEIKRQPAIFNNQGDSLKIHDMEIKEIPDEPGMSGWMTVSGKFANKFNSDHWVARDGDGKEYNVIFRGALTDGVTVTIDGPNGGTSPSYLIAKGMTTFPEKLSLTRTITDKRYTDVDWGFELPIIERNEALKSISIPTYDRSSSKIRN
ncbi:hypothetical protein [Paenibacillus durus]|uniref:DUF4179 domain-containing protein n=1 Tax=Paenibacillus durus ATCC 35681 TaxID=1333534 RepID=A0A0F7F9Q9_PAEDU|nr:hypothetical protein [Paenibacillus durus]AKG34629.1 hypothetical protein VK70_08595 [Paenibacillus durus ATCC 35681]